MRNPAYFIIYLVAIVGFFVPFALKSEGKLHLQPHRAYYTITMVGRPSLHTRITDVRGTMMIELNKVCDGWTAQQLAEIRRYDEDGEAEHVRWGYVTYEADDGSRFKFNTFRKVNEELVEDIDGVAKKNGKLIEAFYQRPDKQTLKLPEGVLFPLQHTKELLKAAQKGEHMFPRVVFDGSTTEGASEINTFIGSQKVAAGNSVNQETSQFSGQPYWPVRFAAYGLGKTDYEPDYVATQDLLPNGIIKQYIIDDGTIKIQGVLDRIELLSPEGC